MQEIALSPSVALIILVIFGLVWIAFGYLLGRSNKTLERSEEHTSELQSLE